MAYIVSGPTKITLNETDTVKSVLQNVGCILRTQIGTCPLYRQFGISTEFVDRPAVAAAALMQSTIKEAIEEFEPRAVVTGVTFRADPDTPGRLTPVVEVEIHEES